MSETRTDTDLTRVAGELYGALMDARPYVKTWTDGQHAAIRAGNGELFRGEPTRAMRTLERCDAALADAADYLNGGS